MLTEELSIENPVFICTGEPSGDMYAGFLVKRIKSRMPHVKVYGVGGDAIKSSGGEVIINYHKLMTFGFATGLSSLSRNYRFYRYIGRSLYYVRPKTFIAVAYPGLNLLLCRYAKKLGCRVYYFIPPQIWAWGSFRKYFIKKWVYKVISVFPFEYQFYKKIGIDGIYSENPLIDYLKQYKRGDFEKRIGFMPGSRTNQVKRNLPIMIELMKKITREDTGVKFVLILHPGESLLKNTWLIALFKNLKSTLKHRLKISMTDRYQTMKNCDMLVTSSGTASLEAAFMNIPQVFFHRPSFFDFYFLKRFLGIKEYNLTNLYFNKKIVHTIIFYNKNQVLNKMLRLLHAHIRGQMCH
jgi:lipid-A-disaccharide synthase